MCILILPIVDFDAIGQVEAILPDDPSTPKISSICAVESGKGFCKNIKNNVFGAPIEAAEIKSSSQKMQPKLPAVICAFGNSLKAHIVVFRSAVNFQLIRRVVREPVEDDHPCQGCLPQICWGHDTEDDYETQ